MDELEEKMLDMLVPPGPKFKKLKWMQEREQVKYPQSTQSWEFNPSSTFTSPR